MDLVRKERFLLPLLIPICIAVVLMTDRLGIIVNLLVIGTIGFIGMFWLSFRYPRYNFIVVLTLAVFMPFLIKVFRLYEFPITNAIEGLLLLFFVILMINGKLSGFKTLPGMLLLGWLGLSILEIANPIAASRVAGVAAIRNLIPMFCSFFIVYSSVENKRDVYMQLVGLMILGLLAGLYGLWQEFAGLPFYDYRWATSTEQNYNLLFTWGRMRKFSFFYSPADFGILMCLVGLAGLVGFFLIQRTKLRWFSLATSLICLWAMVYTGTRTAMVLLAVGFFIFAILTFDRRAIFIGVLFALGIVGLLLRPTTSRSLFVMMTAFNAKADPSMNVRLRNQETIRGYIRTHPFGFGVGSTGWLGAKYSPQTFVGSFPPDSEFVKIAIETGWIGLFIWCTILAILFGFGIRVLFKVRDAEWKTIVVILLCVFYMMIIAHYPQEIFRSQVLSIIFSATIAIITKIDTKYNHTPETVEEEVL
ncbi:MAG TPA: O-antigen ligase family protein [Cyclobacteriaceae bacterium]|nr:O-antigen ligase family protein [Cyclobacteriaceae bacterium]